MIPTVVYSKTVWWCSEYCFEDTVHQDLVVITLESLFIYDLISGLQLQYTKFSQRLLVKDNSYIALTGQLPPQFSSSSVKLKFIG